MTMNIDGNCRRELEDVSATATVHGRQQRLLQPGKVGQMPGAAVPEEDVEGCVMRTGSGAKTITGSGKSNYVSSGGLLDESDY